MEQQQRTSLAQEGPHRRACSGQSQAEGRGAVGVPTVRVERHVLPGQVGSLVSRLVPSGEIVRRGTNAVTSTSFSSVNGSASLDKSWSYECIDTQSELESCGGCASSGEGVDCTTLPGVKSVTCRAGQCEGTYPSPHQINRSSVADARVPSRQQPTTAPPGSSSSTTSASSSKTFFLFYIRLFQVLPLRTFALLLRVCDGQLWLRTIPSFTCSVRL